MDMGKGYNIPTLPLAFDIESKEILRQVNKANRALAELKGIAATIPNEAILINSLIQAIRDKSEDNSLEWEEWILFILKGVEQTARDTIRLVQGISKLMQDYKQILRPLFGKNYKHELLNNLFYHPYTKIEFMQRDLMVQRKTAAKYLNMMVEERVLIVVKIGRENYYINHALMDLFLNQVSALPRQDEMIESATDNQSLL